MSEVDALFRALKAAHPRSAEIVTRFALDEVPLPELAAIYALEPGPMALLVARSLVDVETGGRARPSDREEAEIAAGLATSEFVARLRTHRVALRAMLEASAQAWAASPDRVRDERIRFALIAIVVALSAFFYWREQNKPRPPNEARPTVQPQGGR